MERMEEDQLMKRIVASNVRNVKLRGRMILHDRSEWRAMMKAWLMMWLSQHLDKVLVHLV